MFAPVLALAAGASAQCLNITVPTYPQSVGPDVIVGVLSDVPYYGVANITVPTLGAIDVAVMAVGTTSCNVGNRRLLWVSGTNYHPVIGQNLYRYKNGRFEQIGMSWLKHGFTALANSDCGTCQNPGTGALLGINCSDPYTGSLNGGQTRLGPRYQVNATTGIYAYPYDDTANRANNWARRMLSRKTDVDPALNAGARYVVEGQYVTRDDAGYSNGYNSASIREVRMVATSSGNPPINLTAAAAANAVQSLLFNCTTFRREPGISTWKAIDPAVTLVAVDFQAPIAYVNPASPPSQYDNTGANFITPPTTGKVRFWVGGRVTTTDNITYHYEYAVQNINVDRSGGGFSVPMNPLLDPVVGTVDSRGPFYHSGEPVQNVPWTSGKNSGLFKWATAAYTGVTATDNATYAIRWGTMHNFRFDLNAAPVTGKAKIYLFKPGTAGEPNILKVPGMPVPPPPCPADVADGSGSPVPDGFVSGTDFDLFVQAYYTAQTNVDGDLIADITDGTGTGDPDGFLTGTDFDAYIMHYFKDC